MHKKVGFWKSYVVDIKKVKRIAGNRLMKNEQLNQYIGTEEITIVEAMQKIDANCKGILFIIDKEERLIGSLTDGDIRRWIIKTGDLRGTADQIMLKSPRLIFKLIRRYTSDCYGGREGDKVISIYEDTS